MICLPGFNKHTSPPTMPKGAVPKHPIMASFYKDDAQREIDCELGCVQTEIVAPARVI
jgi:hypothetical protein